MTVHHVFAALEIKSAEALDGVGTIVGWATTPSADRVADEVVPEGAEFSLPLPLLWGHDTNSPIGRVTDARVSKQGIEVVAQVALGVTTAIDDVWKMIKSGLARGLSIGFQGIETEPIPGSWGTRFVRWAWVELSVCVIPANVEASITAVKAGFAAPGVLGGRTAGPPRSPSRAHAVAEKAVETDGDEALLRRAFETIEKVFADERVLGKDAKAPRHFTTGMGRAIKAGIALAMADNAITRRRVAELESKSLAYAGVWQEARSYATGDAVTFGGSMWRAKAATQGQRPDEAHGSWQLVVKKGRDAPRDGRER